MNMFVISTSSLAYRCSLSYFDDLFERSERSYATGVALSGYTSTRCIFGQILLRSRSQKEDGAEK